MSISIQFLENRVEIARIIVKSLLDAEPKVQFYDRFATETDRDFIVDFLIYSFSVPSLSLESIIIFTNLLTVDPSVHKLPSDVYNELLQKVLNSMPILFSDREKKNTILSAWKFYQSVVTTSSTLFINFITEESWGYLLKSIINSLGADPDSDIFNYLAKSFCNGLLLGVINAKEAKSIIDGFTAILFYNHDEQSYWQTIFSIISTKLIEIPKPDASDMEKKAHKFATQLLFTIRNVANSRADHQRRGMILNSFFVVLLNNLEPHRLVETDLLLHPFPIESLLKLFADCVFTKIPTNVEDHLKLLANSSLPLDSKWASVFINFIAKNIGESVSTSSSLQKLSVFSAVRTLMCQQILSPLLVVAHEAALQIHKLNSDVTYWTTVISNIYQRADYDFQNYLSQLTYNFASPEFDPELRKDQSKFSVLYNLITTNNAQLFSEKMASKSLYLLTPMGDIILPQICALFLPLIPSYIKGSEQFLGHALSCLLGNSLTMKKRRTNIIIAIATAAIGLSNSAADFLNYRKSIDLLKIVSTDDTIQFSEKEREFINLSVLSAEAPICTPDFIGSDDTTKTIYKIGNKIVSIGEKNDTLIIEIRSKVGIRRLGVSDRQQSRQQTPRSVKVDLLTRNEIEDGIKTDQFLKYHPKQHRMRQFRADRFFASMNIMPSPPRIEFDCNLFDKLCIPISFDITISAIDLNSKTLNGTIGSPRFTQFLSDLSPTFHTSLCDFNFVVDSDSQILVIFNDTQRLPVQSATDQLPQPVVLVVTLNEDGETYRIHPAKIPGMGFLFPFDRPLEHLVRRSDVALWVSSFALLFFGRSQEGQLSVLASKLLEQAEARERLILGSV